jgi:hypothetical protein
MVVEQNVIWSLSGAKNNLVSFRLMQRCEMVYLRSHNIIRYHFVRSQSFGLCIAPEISIIGSDI